MARDCAGVGGVKGVNLDANWGKQANKTSEPGCVGQMGVNDIRAVQAMPSDVAQPAVRIYPGFSHFEREVFNSGEGQFSAAVRSRAGQGDYCDTPGAEFEAFCEEERLGFGASNRVKSRQDNRNVIQGFSPDAVLMSSCS